MMPVANEIGEYQSTCKLQFGDQKCTLENRRAFRDVGKSSTSCAVARNSSNRNGLHLRQTLFFFTEHNNFAGLDAHANDRILLLIPVSRRVGVLRSHSKTDCAPDPV